MVMDVPDPAGPCVGHTHLGERCDTHHWGAPALLRTPVMDLPYLADRCSFCGAARPHQARP